MRISQEADKLGGNERLSSIAEQYLEVKEQVAEAINTADFDKEEMRRTLQRIEAREDSFLRSKNAFILESKLKQLQDLHWNALCNNIGFLISQYVIWRELPPESYKEPATAKSMIRMADASLKQEKYPEFRRQAFSLTHLMVSVEDGGRRAFKGTGIG